MQVQRMQPWRYSQRLEIMCIFMCILLAHRLEAWDLQIRQIMAILTRGSF